MTETTNYNGWSNRETWLAYTWLTNDEFGYELLTMAKLEYGEDCERAQWISEQYEDSLNTALIQEQVFGEGSLFRDLLSDAFERINWTEIIRNS